MTTKIKRCAYVARFAIATPFVVFGFFVVFLGIAVSVIGCVVQGDAPEGWAE